MLVLLFAIGIIIGSFINVIVYSLPMSMLGNGSIINSQRFFCLHCKHKFDIKELIPLVSYVWQHGKCNNCGAYVPIEYLIVELVSATLAILAFIKFGAGLPFLLVLIFIFSLVTLIIIDIKYKLLPDVITLPLIVLGLVFNYSFAYVEFVDAIIGAALGYLVLWSIFWIYKLINKVEAMGYGDFKLSSVLGAWFGWQSLAMLLLIASVMAIIYLFISNKSETFHLFINKKGKAFALGPFLCLASIFWLFFKFN